MSVIHSQPGARWLLVAGVWLVFATQPTRSAEHPLPRSPGEPHAVQAVPLPTTSVDDQTSWIIEPDVPRIPRIAGLECQLPPHIERRLSYAFDLAQRGATYSANAEFRAVISLCALEMDAREGSTSRREALRQAWLAFDEANDFHSDALELRDAADVRAAAAAHETPVLNQNSTATADAVVAARAYFSFAEERLVYSCRGLPAASLAFYGLGRTCVLPGARVAHAAGKAAVLQRVSLAIAPQNSLAANELGVLLAQHGQLDEAERIFRQCVATNATPETWRNLAVVYARKGNHEASQAAYASSEELLATKQVQSASPLAEAASAARAPDESADRTGFFERLNLSKLRRPFRR